MYSFAIVIYSYYSWVGKSIYLNLCLKVSIESGNLVYILLWKHRIVYNLLFRDTAYSYGIL